jgi:hypothetical protein
MTPETAHHFVMYPHPYPSNPYIISQSMSAPGPSPPWYTDDDTLGVASGLDVDLEMDLGYDAPEVVTDSEVARGEILASPKKAARPAHTPRPPNAWILYRSDKLRAIAAGESLPGLDAVMAEQGVTSSSGSASSGEDSSKEGKGKGKSKEVTPASSVPSDGAEGIKKGSMPPPPTPKGKVKGKKGAKEPTEGYLSLGPGKTGRGLPQADISKMISMLWKRETPEVRAEYERLSELKKIEVRAICLSPGIAAGPTLSLIREQGIIELIYHNSIKRNILATNFSRYARRTKSRCARRGSGRKTPLRERRNCVTQVDVSRCSVMPILILKNTDPLRRISAKRSNQDLSCFAIREFVTRRPSPFKGTVALVHQPAWQSYSRGDRGRT